MNRHTEAAVACPELEELAAFIDGKLAGAERDAVVEHLASCEACYETYAETLRIQEDLGARAVAAEAEDAEPPLAPVVRHPRSLGRAWRGVAALAAGVIFAVGLLWYFFRPLAIPFGKLAEISDWHEHDWSRFRSGSEDPIPRDPITPLMRKKKSFRLGVHFVDIEAALATEKLELAEQQGERIKSLLTELDPLFGPLWTQEAPERIRESSSELEDLLAENPFVDPFYYAFGQWVETSRLMALTATDRHFAGWEFKSFLRRLRKAEAELGVDVARRIQKCRKLVETERIPWDDLVAELDEIIKGEGVR